MYLEKILFYDSKYSFGLNERRKRAFIYFGLLNECAVTEKAIQC